ncbi:MAG: SsrA-binding protein SmpB [bacterium]|nr:SsrA-binding protein SmpB [bacterium]
MLARSTQSNMKVYAENREAHFNYEVLEKFAAGLVLNGQEVKSIKTGRATLRGSYVVLKNSEAFLTGSAIPPYQPNNAPKDYDPQRLRKLLLTKKELNYLIGKSNEKGLALIPLKLFDNRAMIKLEFGLGKGKKKKDKRESIKKKESEREIERELKTRG